MIIAALCVGMPLAQGETENVQTIAVPKLDAVIKLDGHLGEDVWAKAVVFPVNEAHIGAALPGCETTVRIWRSADTLYLGFRCENPSLPVDLHAERRARDQGSVCSDENIEIFIRTPVGDEPTRQCVFNALGSVYDGTFSAGPRSEWDGDWICATTVVRGAWYAEVAIPFSDLGGTPPYILINCCRAGYGARGAKWNTAWKAPGYFKPVFRIDLTP